MRQDEVNNYLDGGASLKYCEKCKKEFEIEDEKCPVCEGKLKEVLSDEDAATIVSTTTLLM